MYSEIPLFPLNIVAYPTEFVNLHIFEPRYKDLVKDCLDNDINFGIPTYNGKTMTHGTELKVLKVDKVYEDGRMDIRTQGIKIFRLVHFYEKWRDKSYAGGKVEYIKNDTEVSPKSNEKMLSLVVELFKWLKMTEKFKFDHQSLSYSIAHKIGLNLDEEFELLKITNEAERQTYIIRHLENLLPALERAENARERIQMNGHFKHLVPPNF